MSFDVSDFKSPLVEADYERGGKVLHLQIDPDILTPEFLDEMAAFAAGLEPVKQTTKKPKKGSTQELAPRVSAQQAETNFFVGVLSRLIKGWDLTRDNNAVEPSPEFFRTLPIEPLTDLFEFCMGQAGPKKQRTGMTSQKRTTREIIPDGSQVEDVSADAQPM